MLRVFCGPAGACRHQRRIHNADIARTQARRNPCFLQFLQKTVIELLVRFRVMLKNVVLNEFFGEIVGIEPSADRAPPAGARDVDRAVL